MNRRCTQYFLLWTCLFVLATVTGAGAQIDREWFAEETESAAEAFRRYQPRSVGVLLVASDRRPDANLNYAAPRITLTLNRQMDGDPFRMVAPYELRLYEAIRVAFRDRGYSVRNLNRSPWKTLRVREVVSASAGVDAVCVVHYRIKHNRKITDRDGYTWWTMFHGMHLRIRVRIYDRASGELIYGLVADALGTQDLQAGLQEMVHEEFLFPSGFDDYGNANSYKIGVYQTSEQDVRTATQFVPVVRTAKGALDIAIVGTRSQARVIDTESMRARNLDIPELENLGSVLRRMAAYVRYRPSWDDVEYYDTRGISIAGRMVFERLPKAAE